MLDNQFIHYNVVFIIILNTKITVIKARTINYRHEKCRTALNKSNVVPWFIGNALLDDGVKIKLVFIKSIVTQYAGLCSILLHNLSTFKSSLEENDYAMVVHRLKTTSKPACCASTRDYTTILYISFFSHSHPAH